MDDHELAKLRKLTGQLHKLTYEAAKAGMVDEPPDEEQRFVRAMQEHMHLKHIHNALEFADLREGARHFTGTTYQMSDWEGQSVVLNGALIVSDERGTLESSDSNGAWVLHIRLLVNEDLGLYLDKIH